MDIKGQIKIATREFSYIQLDLVGDTTEIVDKYFELESAYRKKMYEVQNKQVEEDVPFGKDIDWKTENAIKSKSFKR